MLPQFELQHKRRMHAKRHRDEQRKRVVLILCSVTCCLALLIVFNVYYIYRNAPKVSDYKDNVSGGSTRGGVRKREIWIDRDAQPFVSCAMLLTMCMYCTFVLETEKDFVSILLIGDSCTLCCLSHPEPGSESNEESSSYHGCRA